MTLAILLGATIPCFATPSAANPCTSNVMCIEDVVCDSTRSASGILSRSLPGGISATAAYSWYSQSCYATTQHPYYAQPVVCTVEATADFIVTGVPPGTPLTIQARISVNASAFWSGVYLPVVNRTYGWLQEAGAGRVEAVASAGTTNARVTIVVDRWVSISNVAGEPFRLTMGAGSESREGGGTVSVQLFFHNLPVGSDVHSCAVGPPVPVRSSSWGGLKLR